MSVSPISIGYQNTSQWSIPAQAVPSTPTTIIEGDYIRILDMEISNPTGGNITFTAIEAFSPQCHVVVPTVIYPNSLLTYHSEWGRDIRSGLIWGASSTGLTGYINYQVGYR